MPCAMGLLPNTLNTLPLTHSRPRAAQRGNACADGVEALLHLHRHVLQLGMPHGQRLLLLGAVVDLAHGVVHLPAAERSQARVREGKGLVGQDVGQHAESMPQLDLHKRQRLDSLLGLKDPIAQLHWQATRRTTPEAHLGGHTFARSVRSAALGARRLCCLRFPRVHIGLRGRAQHDGGVDARSHEGALQALEDRLAYHGDCSVVCREDQVAHHGVCPEHPQVLCEERRVEPRCWPV
mmetsp:Transcript_14791/g.40863  ORF Transcript_14791/g.40863 Transcript_14791/m.40863 type:complete len:237 (+) Transcript_14791:106-816(+)